MSHNIDVSILHIKRLGHDMPCHIYEIKDDTIFGMWSIFFPTFIVLTTDSNMEKPRNEIVIYHNAWLRIDIHETQVL